MLNLNNTYKENKLENIVAGGAGFIGSHLIDFLLKKKENVLCIDDLSSGNYLNINHLKDNPKFNFIKFDIRKPIIFDGKIDKIWHLACQPSPNKYQSKPLLTIEVNYKGTLNLLKLATKTDAKILFTSTSEIYVNTFETPQYEEMSINLLTTSSRACYSEGKRLAETLFYVFARKYKTNVRVARLFNIYGPRLRIDDGRVLSNFINQALENKKLTIFGDGSQTRSFCFVSDLIIGLNKLIESDLTCPVNLGNNHEIRINDLAEILCTKLGKSLNYDYLDIDSDEPMRRKPSLEIAKRVLNWESKTPLELGLEKTIEYFRSIR